MFDALFRFFFELSPVVFSQGEFRFAASTGSYVAAAAVAVAAGLTIVAYRKSQRPRAARAIASRWPAIRLAILAIILVCMFRPLLVVKAAVAAAELPRRAAGRFAQHADCRRRRPAALGVREERVRRQRSRAAQGAVGTLHRPHVPLLERAGAHDPGKRSDVRRIAVAARRGAVGRAAGAGRPAGRRAW